MRQGVQIFAQVLNRSRIARLVLCVKQLCPLYARDHLQQLVQFALCEVHEHGHLLRIPTEVFDAERKDADAGYAQVQAPAEDVHHLRGLHAGSARRATSLVSLRWMPVLVSQASKERAWRSNVRAQALFISHDADNGMLHHGAARVFDMDRSLELRVLHTLLYPC